MIACGERSYAVNVLSLRKVQTWDAGMVGMVGSLRVSQCSQHLKGVPPWGRGTSSLPVLRKPQPGTVLGSESGNRKVIVTMVRLLLFTLVCPGDGMGGSALWEENLSAHWVYLGDLDSPLFATVLRCSGGDIPSGHRS